MNLLQLTGRLDKLTLQEVATKGAKLFRSQLNPFTSKEETDKLLNEFLESMSDAGFVQLAPILVEQLQLSKERAEKFESSEAQADAYIKRRPRMEVCRDMIVGRMKEFRQKCNLPV